MAREIMGNQNPSILIIFLFSCFCRYQVLMRVALGLATSEAKIGQSTENVELIWKGIPGTINIKTKIRDYDLFHSAVPAGMLRKL